jgi:anti-sigma factor ChrR (cupin superfamily)
MSRQFPQIDPQEPRIVKTDLQIELVADGVDWTDGDVLTLPGGVRVRILNENAAEARTDLLVKFPPGYVEPAHTHEGAHAALVLDGRMLIDGEELTPGDYLYGQRVEHGPMEYPDGCLTFTSFVGGSIAHQAADAEESGDPDLP